MKTLAALLLAAASCGAASLLDEQFEGAPPTLEGDAVVLDFGQLERESTGRCVQLDSAKDINHDGRRAGTVKFVVHGLEGSGGKWFRFSFHGLPAKDFRVKDARDLAMQVKFFGQNGAEPLDGVIKEIYAGIEDDRRAIEANGNGFKFGSAVWTTYAFDFRLPFNTIDTVELSVRFQNGEGQAPFGSFFVDDVKLEETALPQTAKAAEPAIDLTKLLPVAGRWFYLPGPGELHAPRRYDATNLDRLVYKTGDTVETPFAQSRGAWLRRGNKDAAGSIMLQDVWRPNALQVFFTDKMMIVNSLDLPNHPTGGFPGYLGNPSYIQEQKLTFFLPLDPQPNAGAISMTDKNGNRALNMGPTGIAVNGVVFYNPFDRGMEEAVGIMDRCCGHPNQINQYHYHKYPVCSRSPFEDKGERHSPLIGWAFDGFPVYGPYEGNGEMAMDSSTNPLNAFNIHYDKDRGWHYHVTPGRFPYIIGGYWGKTDARNFSPPPIPR